MEIPAPRLFIRTTGHDGPVRHAVIRNPGLYRYTLQEAASVLYPGRTSNSFALKLGHAPFGEKMAWMDLSEKTWCTVRDNSPLLLYDSRVKDLGVASLDYISPILPATSRIARPEVQDGAGDNPVAAVVARPVATERPIRVTYRYTKSYYDDGAMEVDTASAAGLLPNTYQEAVQYAKESFAKKLREPVKLAVCLRDGTVVNVLPKSFIEYIRETLKTEPGSYICVNDPSSFK